jgi:hypothetical protein
LQRKEKEKYKEGRSRRRKRRKKKKKKRRRRRRVYVGRVAQLNSWLCLMLKVKKGGAMPSALHTASHLFTKFRFMKFGLTNCYSEVYTSSPL